MRHPLSGKVLQYYIAIWAVIIIAHILFLQWNLGLNLSWASFDSIVYNILVAGMGMSYWYVVKFLPPTTTGITNMLVSHIVGIGIVAALATSLSFWILSEIAVSQEYKEFLNRTLSWRIVLTVLYMLNIVMIYYLIQYNFSLQNKEKEEAELQNMLKNAELDMLKTQLNPHFIFNSLNSISSLTITKPERAQEMVIKLSEFLRSSLGKQNMEMHSLKDEFKQMNLYLDIEKIRFGDRLVVKHYVEEGCDDIQIPHLILQPVYENAIKYGLYENLEDVVIETCCNISNSHLVIEISNTFDPESEGIKGNGIGLANIKRRLQVIYDQDDLLEINKTDQSFITKIKLPKDA